LEAKNFAIDKNDLIQLVKLTQERDICEEIDFLVEKGGIYKG
jgi:hypothetical protein